jgi:inorganic pyrophosphatase
MNRSYALDVIRDAHESWDRLVHDESEAAHYGITTKNVTLQDTAGFVYTNDPVYTSLPLASPKPPAPFDSSSQYRCTLFLHVTFNLTVLWDSF